MKYSHLIAKWLKEEGYTTCFFVAGGGIMHLLDGFRNEFECIPVVHENTAGIAAEHFNECSPDKNKAFALVTTGPGLTNIITAISGCYVEHRELLVIAGQVKSTNLLKRPERQRGVQEIDGQGILQNICAYTECLKKPIKRSEFLQKIRVASNPHPGPVVFEICLDVQGAEIDRQSLNDNHLPTTSVEIIKYKENVVNTIDLIKNAQRPIFLIGGLVNRLTAKMLVPKLEKLGIPLATTTSAIDRISTNSKIFVGRTGTWGGHRAANLIIAQSDLCICIGAQLDLQQTGFNYEAFTPNAKLVHVFPSQTELDREGPTAFKKICAPVNEFLSDLLSEVSWKDSSSWLEYTEVIKKECPFIEEANLVPSEHINSFSFLHNLSRAASKNEILALCSSGGTFTGALQSFVIKSGQVATTSCAHASMGYGLATAIGAALSNPGKKIILTEGEGGFSQNLQELALLKKHKLPIKMFIFDNGGYASIRATQKKFFNGAYVGCDPETGLCFPEWPQLFSAYGIQCNTLKTADYDVPKLKKLIHENFKPEAWIVPIDPMQTNWPAVSTVLRDDGTLTSAPLYKMLPDLPPQTAKRVSRYL